MKDIQTRGNMFTVTPPDIKLNDNGPSFLILGETSDNFRQFMDVHDRMIPANDILFYGSPEGITDKNIGWYKAVSGLVDTIFIDLSKATMAELYLATRYTETDKVVFGLANGCQDTILYKLVNNFDGIILFDDLEHFQTSVMTEISQ